MNVPENINDYLHDKGISKSHVARRTGIPNARFSMLTNGKTKMTLDEYIAICDALGVKVTEFIKN
jgi:DNA-binding Xre family transcriptional regulator